ncbi:hypothetical protein RFI_17088 [Reticulomyxa filosa]|uniref:PPM-type phosphatase domain-containing protein n=1 Tax=Reticulomyxa filosa TaxID=46433 RepID=X6N1H3_RETFI|nr:hypothetical protein RFI_17088 [Reticulomyxa filosa]|eukprot:ETO20130.1 hypothetical protein RFI_17088 [Reticulomyxa filosa]
MEKLGLVWGTDVITVGSDGVWDCWKWEIFASYVNDTVTKMKLDTKKVVSVILRHTISRAKSCFGEACFDDASLIIVSLLPQLFPSIDQVFHNECMASSSSSDIQNVTNNNNGNTSLDNGHLVVDQHTVLENGNVNHNNINAITSDAKNVEREDESKEEILLSATSASLRLTATSNNSKLCIHSFNSLGKTTITHPVTITKPTKIETATNHLFLKKIKTKQKKKTMIFLTSFERHSKSLTKMWQMEASNF